MCVYVHVYDLKEILTTLFHSVRRQLLRGYTLISWCQAPPPTWHVISQHINKTIKINLKGDICHIHIHIQY